MSADMATMAQRARERMEHLVATDPRIAAAVPRDAVTQAITAPDIDYAGVIRAVLQGYADRPALAVRDHDLRKDDQGRMRRHALPAFRTISYAELERQVDAICAAWQHEPALAVQPGDFVAYLAFTGAEMVAMDFAAVFAHAVSVPLQANLGQEEVGAILSDVSPTCLVASIDHLDLATVCALTQPGLRSVIVIDVDEQDDVDRARIKAAQDMLNSAASPIACVTFAQLAARGEALAFSPPSPRAEGRDAVSMIMYTSGSTGTPKGAIIHEAINMQFWCALPAYQPCIAVAYAPMNHFMGRNQIFAALAQGGTAYISLRSDLSTLFEDIRLANPTTLLMIPRVCEIIYQHYQSEVQRRVALGEAEAEADAAVRADMACGYLGTRLVSAGTGSSPTAPEVRAFIRDCFGIAFIEGYGSTEAGGGASVWGDQVQRGLVIDYKLRDVPELGYYGTDRPFPRGELLIKTRLQIQGYFKRPEATAGIFDEDGYVITGDIMEQRGPDQLAWVDRRSSVIKLSQAEFVAIGPLESTFLGGSSLIRQIYVHGSSWRAYLLAVVVPDLAVAGARLGHAASNVELRDMVLAEFAEVARAAGLKSFEIPRDVLIEREPFSMENGLLSSVRKPLRPNLKRRYADALEAMYQNMEREQQQQLAQLRTAGADVSTRDRVAAAIRSNLGLPAIDPQGRRSYRDLGGDSLGGVALAALLDEMFGVDVPVGMILGPDGTIDRIATFVDAQREGSVGRVTFDDVHGTNAQVISPDQLVLPAFLDEAALTAAAAASPPSDEPPACVLLTGATGFLGRFLCLEWLEHMAHTGSGKVIALVRAADAEAGRQRLFDLIGAHDPALAAHFAQMAEGRLEVVAGDLDLPRLGLSTTEYDRLAAEVDRIVHPGAFVNHRLSYQALFGANVAGTAELLRLALTARQKPVDYVSTVGVPHLIPGLAAAAEDADVRLPGLELPLRDDYAFGYAASKWAGEVLLRDAAARANVRRIVYLGGVAPAG
ncbi:MAG: hypothetical protein RIS94_2321, partial [Pseudomonadota bacterium]